MAEGGAALAEAVRRGDVRAAQEALGGGTSPESVDGDGDGVPVLGLAARSDDVPMLGALFEGGADARRRSRGGLTALMPAADACAYQAAENLGGDRSYLALRDELGCSALPAQGQPRCIGHHPHRPSRPHPPATGARPHSLKTTNRHDKSPRRIQHTGEK